MGMASFEVTSKFVLRGLGSGVAQPANDLMTSYALRFREEKMFEAMSCFVRLLRLDRQKEFRGFFGT